MNASLFKVKVKSTNIHIYLYSRVSLFYLPAIKGKNKTRWMDGWMDGANGCRPISFCTLSKIPSSILIHPSIHTAQEHSTHHQQLSLSQFFLFPFSNFSPTPSSVVHRYISIYIRTTACVLRTVNRGGGERTLYVGGARDCDFRFSLRMKF